MTYKKLEKEIEEFCQFLGIFASKAAYVIAHGAEEPADMSGFLSEILSFTAGTSGRMESQKRITKYDLEQIQYAARNFSVYLRDEQFRPSILGIFPKPEHMDNVADLSDKLSNKCGRAISLLERIQMKSRTLEQDMQDMYQIAGDICLEIAAYIQKGGEAPQYPSSHWEETLREFSKRVIRGDIESGKYPTKYPARDTLGSLVIELKKSMEQESIKPLLLKKYNGMAGYNKRW